MKPIAIVTPWFGEALKGGAEQLAWQLAHRLHKLGISIEVLTTCCKSFFADWGTDHLKPGKNTENGFTIRRFPVNFRNDQSFNRVNRQMLAIEAANLKPGVSPVSDKTSAIFSGENINSMALLEHLARNKDTYRNFLFIPYLYGPILNGLPLVADRAYLQPCLHNEVYAYLPEVEYIFHKAKGLLFNSEGEALLAQELYGPGITRKSLVVGTGIEIAPEQSSSQVKKVGRFDISNSRYVFYLGRRDSTKNVDFLIDAYKIYWKRFQDENLNLVLAGPGEQSYGKRCDGVIDLELVSEKEKCALLKACIALFQPSRNESYSRVMMEAWYYRKPVVANRLCLATSTFVRQSRGGWLADTIEEWIAMFHQISRSAPEVLDDYGQNGYEYAQKHADWKQVIKRYKDIFFPKNRVTAGFQKAGSIKTVHQLVADVAPGDAITNYALALKNYLRQNNYRSELLVQNCNYPNLLNEIKIFKREYLDKRTGIIYHHSIGSGVTQYAIQHQGPKSLIYHNVTPAKFFESYRPNFSKLLRKGRADLNLLSQSFSIAAGDSAYNTAELEQAGFHHPQIMPIPIDPGKWNLPPDPHVMNIYQDGRTNLLFVGRVAPNKCQHHLIEAFEYYLTMDPRARLIMAGNADPGDPYVQFIYRIIQEKNLRGRVVVTNRVSDSKLHAFYRTAHLFWSMSEHEGFGIPLIEAMWFDVPILAFKSSAVPETLGEAGLLFTGKDDFLSLAALAKVLVKDEDIKYKVLAAQRRRRMAFAPDVVLTNLLDFIRKMELQGDR